MSLDATRANQVLDALHAVATLPASTSPIRVRQMTANGTDTTAGTELGTSGGYTGGASAPSVTMASAASKSSASSTAVSITNMPAATVVGIELWDSNATPKRQSFGALSASKTTAAGDTLSYAAGAITESIS